jgi:hypothetical protein
MSITGTPASLPSVFNDVMANMAAMVDRMNIRTPRGSLSRFNCRIRSYSGGSDHAIFNDRKIPAAMIGHGDYTHHTSEDTPDKVDPVELERAEMITAAAILYLADLDESRAVDLACLAAANSAQRLGLAGRQAISDVSKAGDNSLPSAWAEAENLLRHRLEWEHKVLKSILHYYSNKNVKSTIEDMKRQQESQHRSLVELLRSAVQKRGVTSKVPPQLEPKPDERVPIRLTRGPLASGFPEEKIPEEDAEWYQNDGRALHRNMRYEIVNFIDGRRTISEIRHAVSAEYNPIPTPIVARYIEDLVKAKVVKWK